MAYKDYLTTKFRQSDMIGAVLKAANKEADMKTEKDGVCSTMTMPSKTASGWAVALLDHQ